MAALTFGMTDTGVLVHEPGIDGHLRLVGHDLGDRPASIVEHFETDCEIIIVSPSASRQFSRLEKLEFFTTASGAPAGASVIHDLLDELEGRVEDPECDTLVVIEDFDQLLAPAFESRKPEGTFAEVDRMAAKYLTVALDELLVRGPARGIAVLATFYRPPRTTWQDTSTIVVGEYGQTFERDGRSTPFTWV